LTPTKPAPLLRATSNLRSLQTKFESLSQPTDLDIDKISLPPGVEWKHQKVPATKRTVVSKAPKVLAVHLVRSIYERGLGAGRNSCEVSFDEDIDIPLGGETIEQQEAEEVIDNIDEFYEQFRLMSVVTHKGGHDSGHYICYRRRKRERKARSTLKSNGAEKEEDVVVEVVGEGVVGEGNEGVTGLEDGVEELALEVDSRTKWWEISDEVVTGVQREDVLSKRKGVYILFYEKTL
jgi:ubiquitin C-terminal hydrolase